MASEPNRCPNCGANLTGAVCPQCQAALPREAKSPDVTTTNAAGGSTPADFEVVGSVAGSRPSTIDGTGEWTPGRLESTVTADGRSPSTVLPSGTVVRYFGDYEIQKELGRGGMGFVYLAKQMSLNRLVALKMIKAGLLADDNELRRFRNEAEAVALLDHPGIVPVYEVGDHEGQRYFSMKLIEGGNLDEQLAKFKEHPRTAVPLLRDVADAIQHAHIRGILHRDLKPANILLDLEGHPHITDFGLAKRIESDVELTQSGAFLGTPAYMSPEQALGRRGSITTSTDVYGLGAILYAMLTGKAPFGGDSVMETLDAVRTRPPEPPTKRNDKIPRDLELICLKCLEKSPADRYPSAGALADDLGRFAAGEPVSVRAAGMIERVAKWARRKPTLAAAYLLGFLALTFGGLGGVALRQWRSASIARDDEKTARSNAETARDGEAKARLAAETARDGETKARLAADGLRKQVEGIEYGRSMEVAYDEYRESTLAATIALLNRTNPVFRGWEYRYVHRLTRFELLTLQGHASNVTSASYSADGSRIVTSSYDHTAKIWDASTGAVIVTLKGHKDTLMSAAFSPDGSRVVTVDETEAKVWDAKTGAEILTVKPDRGYNRSAAFSPDGTRIVTGSYQTVQVWNAATGVPIHHMKGHEALVRSVSFSGDGSRIVSTSDDKTARVWDANAGTELLVFKGHSWAVSSASFSPDMSRIVTSGWDEAAKVWDAKTGAEILTLRGPDTTASAAFSPDGLRIATAGGNAAKVWDAKTGAELITIKGHISLINTASFSPDGARVLTASDDRSAKVWDSHRNAEFLTFQGQTLGETSASFSPDGSRIISASNDRTAKVWDASTGTQILTIKGHTAPVVSAWYSPDGARIVTGSSDRSIRFHDAKTGAYLLSLNGRSDGYVSPFSPDGSRVVTGGWDRNETRDARTGFQMVFEVSNPTARVWDTTTGNQVLTLKGHTNFVTSASFRRDGLRIVTTSRDQTSRVWDARTGAELLILKGPNYYFTSASFSPDGTRIVTSGNDMAKVWNASTGAEMMTLRGHTGWVTSAAYSPDGSRIVTVCGDGTVKLWDADTGAEVLSLKMPAGQNNSASFSADGSRIIAVGRGIRIWDASPINRNAPATKTALVK